jgi:hypothetical protein
MDLKLIVLFLLIGAILRLARYEDGNLSKTKRVIRDPKLMKADAIASTKN